MTARITTQLSDELYAQAKALAREGRESVSWLVERAVRREVARMLALMEPSDKRCICCQGPFGLEQLANPIQCEDEEGRPYVEWVHDECMRECMERAGVPRSNPDA